MNLPSAGTFFSALFVGSCLTFCNYALYEGDKAKVQAIKEFHERMRIEGCPPHRETATGFVLEYKCGDTIVLPPRR